MISSRLHGPSCSRSTFLIRMHTNGRRGHFRGCLSTRTLLSRSTSTVFRHFIYTGNSLSLDRHDISFTPVLRQSSQLRLVHLWLASHTISRYDTVLWLKLLRCPSYAIPSIDMGHPDKAKNVRQQTGVSFDIGRTADTSG